MKNILCEFDGAVCQVSREPATLPPNSYSQYEPRAFRTEWSIDILHKRHEGQAVIK